MIDRLGESLTYYWFNKNNGNPLTDEEIDEVLNNKSIKPGVSELFESNPELANAVYEALIPGYKERLDVDKYLKLHKNDFAVKILNKLIDNGGIIMSSFSLAKQGFVKRDMNQKMNDVDIIIPESNDEFRKDALKWMQNIFGKNNVKLLNDFKDSPDSNYNNKFFLVAQDAIEFSEMKENGFLRGATVVIKDGKEWIKVDTAQYHKGEQPNLFDKNTISAESTLAAKKELAKRGEQKHIDDIKNWEWFEQQKQQAQILYSQYLEQNPNGSIEDFKRWIGDNKDNKTANQDEGVGGVQYQLPQGREQKEFIASEKTIRDLAARMSDRIGIPVRFESDRTKQYKGKLENGVAVINLAYATLDTVPHELIAHPIIRALKVKSEKSIESEIEKMIEIGIIKKEC